MMPRQDNDYLITSSELEEPGGPGDTIYIIDENLRGGFAQVPRPVLKARGLSGKAKLVYILLLDYAWQKGSCFPGQPRMAQDLDVSVDTIQRGLNELKGFGLVDWKQQGLNRTNIYYILPLSGNERLLGEDEEDEGEGGSRKLRFQKTAKYRYPETAKSGHINIHSEYTQKNNIFEKKINKRKGFTPEETRQEPSSVGHILAQTSRKRLKPSPMISDQALEAVVADVSAELGDSQHLGSNLSQAHHLLQASNLPEASFLQLAFEAASVVRDRLHRSEREGGQPIKNKMAYYFATLKESLAAGKKP